MSSTTLMTFLLCVNPNVRSVKLLGSWDNFSKPYSMERDRRVGPGQWRGCHTFTDIVRDGSHPDPSNGRSGGLKMGGTYWYYYLLDDDVEFHNEAEPSTTRCPLLPGQPVNVLHVPIILPDSRTHGRGDSGSSGKSNYRTMNPEDKYLNPREPPKPKPRLRTSPVLPQARDADWFLRAAPSAISKSTSQPASPTRERDNGSKPARSLSPPRSRGFFRHFNSSSPDVGNASRRDVNTGESLQGCAKSSGRGRDCHQVPRHSDNHCDLPSSTKVKRTPPNTDRLPFRQPPPPSNTEPMPLSIQDRRALKSRSRDGSPNKSVLRVETRLGNGKPFGERPKRNKRSPEAKDSSSPRKSSLLLNAAKKLGVSRNSTSPKSRHSEEKSLPTLPNSPSSVMDEALRDIGANERALDMEMLCSRFSDITATEESPASDSPREKSRFSKWSTDSDAASPESMTSSSTFNPDSHTSPIGDDSETRRLSKTPVPMDYNSPATPHSTGVSELSTPSSVIKKASIGLGLPYLSVSETSPQLDIPEISIDEVDHVESNPKRHAAFFGKEESIKALKMRSPDASATGFYGLQGDSEHPHGATDQHQTLDGFSNAQLQRQSAAMQELMDELSYLKNTIESGRGGSST